MKLRPQNSWRYRITSFLGKSLIFFLEQAIKLFIDDRPVFSPDQFPWIKKVEEYYPKIRSEYDELMRKPGHLPDICDISEEQYSVIDREQWTFFPLYIYGIPIGKNLERCHETAKALALIPNKTTVFFSIIKPGSYIKPHRGAYKGYLRYHLGVDIPADAQACGIRILETTYHWRNGQSLIFDDTFRHDAWNNSDSLRAVLYVDFIRPMPAVLMWVSHKLTGMISGSPFVQNALIKMERHGSVNDVAATVN